MSYVFDVDKTKRPSVFHLNTPNIPMRVVVVGNSGVGKTSLVRMFTTHEFMFSHLPTVGIDFGVRTIAIPDKSASQQSSFRTAKQSYSTMKAIPTTPTKNIKLQLWDCAGQEKFRSITRSYYRDARGVLLMFDVCDRSSFHALNRWLREIIEEVSDKCVIWIIGNKRDKLVPCVEVGSAHQETNDIKDNDGNTKVESYDADDESDSISETPQKEEKNVEKDEINEWISKNGLRYAECCVKHNPIDRNVDALLREFAIELDRVFNHSTAVQTNKTELNNDHDSQVTVSMQNDSNWSSSCCYRS